MTDAPPPRHGIQARRMPAEQLPGMLRLPVCASCMNVCYPLRELCPQCLADALAWQPVDDAGLLLVRTTLHRSNEPWFVERLPLSIGSVKMDAGPVVIAFIGEEPLAPGGRVRLCCETEAGGGEFVLVARAPR